MPACPRAPPRAHALAASLKRPTRAAWRCPFRCRLALPPSPHLHTAAPYGIPACALPPLPARACCGHLRAPAAARARRASHPARSGHAAACRTLAACRQQSTSYASLVKEKHLPTLLVGARAAFWLRFYSFNMPWLYAASVTVLHRRIVNVMLHYAPCLPFSRSCPWFHRHSFDSAIVSHLFRPAYRHHSIHLCLPHWRSPRLWLTLYYQTGTAICLRRHCTFACRSTYIWLLPIARPHAAHAAAYLLLLPFERGGGLFSRDQQTRSALSLPRTPPAVARALQPIWRTTRRYFVLMRILHTVPYGDVAGAYISSERYAITTEGMASAGWTTAGTSFVTASDTVSANH